MDGQRKVLPDMRREGGGVMERIIEIVDHGGPDGWHSYSFGEAREKVVRCRDCKDYRASDQTCHSWQWHNWDAALEVDPEGFCAWGERRV